MRDSLNLSHASSVNEAHRGDRNHANFITPCMPDSKNDGMGACGGAEYAMSNSDALPVPFFLN